MGEAVKIAFLGDITCDRPMLQAAGKGGRFDFVKSLEQIKPLLADCDLAVANLETVFAGRDKGYNPFPISYNSPDVLCEGIKAAGIALLTTANNHCLDMGGEGLERTLDILDRYGLGHTGTYKRHDCGPRFLTVQIRDMRVALVSLTDRLNDRADGGYHREAEWQMVNNLRAHNAGQAENKLKKALKKILPMKQIKQIRAGIKRKRGIALVTAKTDNEEIAQRDKPQIDRAIALLKEARQEADYVVACVHSGGQFNYEPGRYSQSLFDLLEPHCDAIIGNHPHVIQRMERHGDKLRAYSLGSINMSPSADYVSRETDFQYSAVVKLTLEKQGEQIKLARVEQTLLHAEETDGHYVLVRPAEDTPAAQQAMHRLCQG